MLFVTSFEWFIPEIANAKIGTLEEEISFLKSSQLTQERLKLEEMEKKENEMYAQYYLIYLLVMCLQLGKNSREKTTNWRCKWTISNRNYSQRVKPQASQNCQLVQIAKIVK
jgi:hypothetical protein